MKRTLRKILPALLALCLLLSSALAEPAASRIADDGLIRVYLKTLAGQKSLHLTLKGVYAVDGDGGFRFAPDSSLQLSEGEGSVYMSIGGLTMKLGESITLTRQASDAGEKGVYIAESERNTLYMGDLSITAKNGGLHVVLTIAIEDYLCGVVGYEMNNSWPIEALKAQAVAARTYAMQRKANSGDRDYDVVDTAGDQVFKGFDERHANVHQAVRETAGVVGIWKGEFASCYYTASNGGETALPVDVWGTAGDYGYLDSRSDPYDLENPSSKVLSTQIQADGSGNPELRAMLDAGLLKAAGEQGLNTRELELEQIISIEPIEPAAEGSRMYTKLRFTIGASAVEAGFRPMEGDAGALREATASMPANLALGGMETLRRLLERLPYEYVEERKMLAAPVVVEIDVYQQIKGELGLAMNSRDCELVTVRKDDEKGFSIEMRRYGHGVGMSQRGAQTMAGDYGKSYQEILSFYYPGMTLEKIEWDSPELVPLKALPDSVKNAAPLATPAPLPTLEEGEYYATVILESSDNLNLRAQPTTESDVVTLLAHGQDVIVCGEADALGWVAVRTASHSGYVMLEFLQAK